MSIAALVAQLAHAGIPLAIGAQAPCPIDAEVADFKAALDDVAETWFTENGNTSKRNETLLELVYAANMLIGVAKAYDPRLEKLSRDAMKKLTIAWPIKDTYFLTNATDPKDKKAFSNGQKAFKRGIKYFTKLANIICKDIQKMHGRTSANEHSKLAKHLGEAVLTLFRAVEHDIMRPASVLGVFRE